MGSKGFLESNELIIPVGKVVLKSLDGVFKGDDFALEIEDIVLGFSDNVVKGIDLSVVFVLSFLFSGSFLIKTFLFGSQKIVDDVQNGTNEFLVGLDGNILGHLHKNLEKVSSGVGGESRKRSLGMSRDLGQNLIVSLLEERRGLQGLDEGTSLLESVEHSVVVSGALSIGSRSMSVSIVSIFKIAFSLLKGVLFSLQVNLSGGQLKVEVRKIDVSLGNLAFFVFNLFFVAFSGSCARVRSRLEIFLRISQRILSLSQKVIEQDEDTVNDVFLVLGRQFQLDGGQDVFTDLILVELSEAVGSLHSDFREHSRAHNHGNESQSKENFSH